MARLQDRLFGTSAAGRVAVKASDIIRPLGPFEHLFWLLDQHRSVHFAVTAQIAGKARPDEWRQALDRVQERHPLLSVSIEGRPPALPRFRRETAAPIPLRVVEGDPKTRWEAEVVAELETPFDPNRAPLARAVLIESSRDTAFILAAHHSIADALSLAYAIRDTLCALAGEALEPLALAPAQEEMLGAGVGSAGLPLAPAQEEMLGAGVGPAVLAGARGQPEGGPAGRPSRFRPLDDARPLVKGLLLAPDLTASLAERARQEGTTVHGALCAAVAIACRLVSADWRSTLRIMSPINLRPLLGAGEGCGLFVSAATGALDERAVGFWELARHAKAATAVGQRRDSVAALLSAVGELVGKGADIATVADFAAVALAHEAMLTNLGVLSFPRRFGALTLESVWGPAVLTALEGTQTIGVATVDGSISLTHTSHRPAEGLLETMRSVLADACADQRATSVI